MLTLEKITDDFYAWIDRIAQSKGFVIKLSLFLMFSSIVLSFPTISAFNPNSLFWETVKIKADDLLHPLTHLHPSSGISKKVFRLLIPMVMKYTHLSPIGIIVLQYINGFFLFVFSYKLSLKILNDRVSATLVTAGLAFIFFGRTSFFEINWTTFDGFSFCLLILALYYEKPFLVFLFSFLAAWNDERAFIALVFVYLFKAIFSRNLFSRYQIKKIFTRDFNVNSPLIAVAAYLFIRYYLSMTYDMHTPTTGANYTVLLRTTPFIPMSLWTFLEGFWLLFISVIIFLLYRKYYILIIILGFSLFPLVMISSFVTDMTRSGAYIVPVIFLLLKYLVSELKLSDLRLILLLVFLVSLLFPPLAICPDQTMEECMPTSVFIKTLNSLVNHLF
jgi:hypothetical protein